jgi:serine/threonine protein kinase
MFHQNQRIGPYALVCRLGRGSFGEVWLAKRHDAIAAPDVALKMPTDDPSDIDAIRREAEMWVRATGHPNVLPVIEANIYDNQVVIVSEYVAGGTLSRWLLNHGGKAPSIQSAVEITAGILAGLHHLHTRTPHPIVHCDLKPDNIMMQGDIPRLTDFGIARITRTTAYTRQFTGTLAYMSPEAFKGGYSPQRDLWAVGVILYHLLTGCLPFPQEDAPQIMAAILTEDPPELPEAVPMHLRNIVAKALRKDPAQRFASAEEMRYDLLQIRPVQQQASPTLEEQAVDPLLPSQTPTVNSPLMPRVPEASRVPVSPSSGSPKTGARVVRVARRSMNVTSAKQMKLDEQNTNRRTLAVIGCLIVLSFVVRNIWLQELKEQRSAPKPSFAASNTVSRQTVPPVASPVTPNTQNTPSNGAEGDTPAPSPPAYDQIRTIPEGMTLEVQGDHAYFRDAVGNLAPVPDGRYPYEGDNTLTVRGGSIIPYQP